MGRPRVRYHKRPKVPKTRWRTGMCVQIVDPPVSLRRGYGLQPMSMGWVMFQDRDGAGRLSSYYRVGLGPMKGYAEVAVSIHEDRLTPCGGARLAHRALFDGLPRRPAGRRPAGP